MSDKLTPKQEQFCRKFIECGNQSEAYRYAYDVGENTQPETVWVNASQLMTDTKVAQRVLELQKAATERTLVTVESITAELNESRALAIEQDNPAEMTKASMAKAKLHGLDVHKIDVKGSVSVNIDREDADL